MKTAYLDSAVAVIGMACRLPGARDLDEFWNLVRTGGVAWGKVPEVRLDRRRYYHPTPGTLGRSYADLAALVDYREPDRQLCPLSDSAIITHDVAHVTLCEVAASACRHAGLDPAALPYDNTGVYIGHAAASGLAADLTYATYIAATAKYLREAVGFEQLADGLGDQVIEEIIATVRREKPHRKPDGSPFFGACVAAGLIAKTFALSGPSMSFNAACASSSRALAQAVRALQLGTVDMALVGGASYFHSDTLVLFSQSRSLSANGSHPFSAEADGMVVGEGYVMLVLKRLAQAIADKDRILAVVPAVGLSSDGRGKSLWAPRQEGQVLAIQRAYGPQVSMADLQYIEAHATSTALGDQTEVAALTAALAGQLPPGKRLPVGSAKLNVGHTLESAGLVGVVKTVLALQHEVIPPAIDERPLNPQIDWDNVPLYVPRQEVPWPRATDGRPRRAGVDAFGIGGLNVHVVIDEFLAPEPTAVAAARVPSQAADKPASDDDAIAIVGMGAVLPGALTLEAFWDLLTTGRDPKTEATDARWDTGAFYRPGAKGPWAAPTKLGGYITDFAYDWRKHKVPPKQITQASPLQFMILDAVDQALQRAGYHERPFDRQRVGVVVGTIFGGDYAAQLVMGLRLPEFQDTLADLLRAKGVSEQLIGQLRQSYGEVLLEHMPALLDETGSFTASALASRITKSFDLMGGAVAVDAGEASSMAALSCSIDLLRSGDCDMMIAVGAQQDMTPTLYEDWSIGNRLATGTPRSPFDARADGIVPGEGCGALVLKRLADARRDHNPIVGILRGMGAAYDAVPSQAAGLAIRRAMAAARITPDDVAVVETTAAGRRDRDAAELHGLAEAYGVRSRTQPILLGTVTGQIGNTSGASGVALLLKAALEVEKTHMPADVGLERPAPYLTRHEAVLRVASQASPIVPVNPEGRVLAGVHTGGDGEVTYHVFVERGSKMNASNEAVPSNGKKASQEMPSAKKTPATILEFDATARRREKMRQKGSTPLQPQPSPAAPASNGENGSARPLVVEPSPLPVATHRLPAGNGFAESSTPLSRTTVPTVQPIAEPLQREAATPPPSMLDPTELEKFLVSFVVEQTGYPPEIVELDADLEADLGIDSIKKAQLFGELGEYFDVQPSADLSLDSFPTLRHVLDFLVKSQTNVQPIAAAPVATAPAPPAAEPAGLDPKELEKFLVSFVVEQTGYPPEIVELDADLEADLGIDSIKKAQLFGELGEYFDVQPSADLSLDSFPTLRHVLDFLVKAQAGGHAAPAVVAAPAPVSPPDPAAAPPAVESANLDPNELEKFLVSFVVEQTGYPPEIVELDADLEADLGIDSIKKAQLFGELGEYFDVQPSADLSLDSFPTLRHVLDFLLQNVSR
jgi:acyl transferase domain-containing protein/acyl carrier protein